MRRAGCILFLSVVAGVCTGEFVFPKCWKHYGECLDKNEPPLKVNERVKPKENLNVIKAVQNIFTVGDCLRECEKESECEYFTHYSRDPLKSCLLVGFNLGGPCHLLPDVCVLHRNCATFDKTCGKACTSGRRLVVDLAEQRHTLIIGGSKQDRTEFETTGEVLNESGSVCSPDSNIAVAAAEGAAGAFIQNVADPDTDHVLVCGGWNNDDKYKTTCETMVRGAGWASGAQVLATARAYHSMVAVGAKAYVFGGYNAVDGMLDSIEEYDATTTTWTTAAIKLASPRSHTCAVTTKIDNKDMVFVVGGWGADLAYMSNIAKFDVTATGALAEDTSFSVRLPADRVGVSPGRSDMACVHYRLEGWRDGILVTGGYRSSGAWLNTAWFLDLGVALDASDPTDPWIRINDIAEEFDGGRHFHGLTLASSQPLLVGGWRSGPLASSLLFSECEGDDPTRPGAWKLQKEDSQQLTVGREKFVSVGVPLTMIPSANRCA